MSSSSGPAAGPTPAMQTPNCTTCVCPSQSTNPVQYFNGAVILRDDDLTTPSGGLFGHSRYFANQLSAPYLGPNGYNWCVSQLPYAATHDGGATVAVFVDPNNPYWFTLSGGSYSPTFASVNALDTTLVDDGTYLTFTQTDGGKTRITVYNNFAAAYPGTFVSYTDERGVQTVIASITGGVIDELQRSCTVSGITTIESLQYAWFTSGLPAGLLQTVTYRKQVGGGAWTYLKRGAFAYYGASDLQGSVNDLLSATQQIYNGTDWDDVAVNYYRYHVSGDTGFVHGLKSHFGPEACRLMFNAGIDLSTASDSAIQQYADHIFQYGPSQEVTVETSAVCPSCPGGGTTLDLFSYSVSAFSNAVNSWATKTQQVLPDSSQKIVYCNYTGMAMLEIVIDPTGLNRWATFHLFDSNGREIWKALPSAVALPASLATLEANADLLNYDGGTGLFEYLNNSTGLIEVTNYYSATGSGAVAGYVASRGVQQGQSGTPVLVNALTYSSNTDSDGNTIYPVATRVVYPVAGDTSTAYTTSLAYLYYSGTNQPSQKTTTLPVVSALQNGSGSADTTVELLDIYGNRTQFTDERGIVSNFTFDPVMTRLLTQVLNYQSGVTAPGVNVTTNNSFDDFGRILTSLGDMHTVVISGAATSVQPVTSYAYSQSVQPGSGIWAPDQNTWAKGYFDGTNYTLIDPVTVLNIDKDGRNIDRITSHRTSGSGLLSPTETFAQTDWLTWKSTQYSNSHQTISNRTYILIPSSGIGTLGVHYGETDLAYDALERRNRKAVWTSASAATITRTVWTTPQREASTWIGTDDSGATDSNPAGTNSVQFVQAGSQASATDSVSVALVNNVTAGNTLLAYGCQYSTAVPGSTAVTDSLGNAWTLVTSQAGGSAAAGGAGLWVANITTGGAAVVTFAAEASPCALAVAEYSGVVAVSPVDTSASATNSSGSTTPASGSMTTANAGDLIFAGASQGNAAVRWSPGAGFIIRATAGSSGTMTAAIQDQLVTATGTYDPTFTIDTSQPWTAIAAALMSTAPSSSNNMVQITGNIFDSGLIGDGNLTQQTRYASATSVDNRVTNWGFDFRNRKITTTGEENTYEVLTLDNLGRATLTQDYNGPGGNLIAQSGKNFDARGRQYQTLEFAVDPATGIVGNVLVGNTWYDPSSNTVQQVPPGAGTVFTKSEYNGVNWVTATYTGYNTSGVSYSQAQTVSGDIIVEQAQNTFDEVGNTVSVASFQRLNDASTSTTGALTGSLARILYSASWFDGIDRRISSANYGAAASFSRPSTPPASSSTVLVSGVTFDEAGRVYQRTDPKGRVDELGHDNASRITQTIEDVAGLALTTNYAYTLDNNNASMTVLNPVTGDQTTAWLYGTTLADSGVARADLLSQAVYPDVLSWATLTVDQWANLSVDDWATLSVGPTGDVTSKTYNRLSEKRTFTDQRGTAHTYFRDKLGRETYDCVTTLGADTDGTVLQIATAYEARGMVATITSTDSDTPGSGAILNQVQLTYNSFAQLALEQQSHSGAVTASTPAVGYAYDTGAGGSNEIRFTGLIYPSGRPLAYNFVSGMDSTLNRVTSISDPSATLASYTYLGLGTVVRIAYPQPGVWLDLWGGSSGVFAGLDVFNRIIDQRWQNNTGGTRVDIDRYLYGFDLNSNRQYKANAVGTPIVSGGLDEYYTMDDINRLTDMQRGVLNGTNTGITGTPAREMAYTLDPTGNWPTYLTKTNGTTDLNQGRGSNVVNEITNITESGGTPLWVTPAYDAAGNMTTVPQPGAPTSSFAAVYDAWKRMTAISAGGSPVGQYQYDGRHRRIITLTSETRHFYFTSSWQDIEQRVGTATTMDRQHVWGIRYPDELVCRDDATPERLYATYDANFNLTSICDVGGAPQEHYYFDPYGSRAILNGSWSSISTSAYSWSIGHQGLAEDVESGLIYNRSRVLHSTLGVFAQRDPIWNSNFGDPNLYQYELSEPAGLRDPSGLTPLAGDPALALQGSVCLANPPTTQPPCPDAKLTAKEVCDRAVKQGAKDADQGGGVICVCEGTPDFRKVPCDFHDPTANHEPPGAIPIISDCIIAHENVHAAQPDTDCGGTAKSLRIPNVLPPGKSYECDAYKKELECLTDGRAKCKGSPECETAVDARASGIRVELKKRKC